LVLISNYRIHAKLKESPAISLHHELPDGALLLKVLSYLKPQRETLNRLNVDKHTIVGGNRLCHMFWF